MAKKKKNPILEAPFVGDIPPDAVRKSSDVPDYPDTTVEYAKYSKVPAGSNKYELKYQEKKVYTYSKDNEAASTSSETTSGKIFFLTGLNYSSYSYGKTNGAQMLELFQGVGVFNRVWSLAINPNNAINGTVLFNPPLAFETGFEISWPDTNDGGVAPVTNRICLTLYGYNENK